MTDEDRLDVQQALLYKLRRIFTRGEKETYTVQEICDLLDKIADAMGQE